MIMIIVVIIHMNVSYINSIFWHCIPISGRIVMELNSIEYVPYSVYNWLEIVRRFESGTFHRNAGHVLQAQVSLKNGAEDDLFKGQGLAFQEYNKLAPHKKLSFGYAGKYLEIE